MSDRRAPSMADERAPLLSDPGYGSHAADTLTRPNTSDGNNGEHRLTSHWNWGSSSARVAGQGASVSLGSVRHRIQRFLTSRWGHYTVIALVSVDVACIFAGFLIDIYQCEHNLREACKPDGPGNRCHDADVGPHDEALDAALDVFEITGLVISCLFMVELLLSLWAFGLRYLKSWFHILDATVIIASFIVDVGLKGVLEEVGSIVVVLRLWRVIKIIEEFSAGVDEQMDGLNEHIGKLIAENKDLRRRLASARVSEDD